MQVREDEGGEPRASAASPWRVSWRWRVVLGSVASVGVVLTASSLVLSLTLGRQDRAEEWMWAGDVTSTSFQLRIKGRGFLVVSPSRDPASPVFTDELEGEGVNRFLVAGLSPSTEYLYGLAGSPTERPTDTGRVKTWASSVQPLLRVAAMACASTDSDDLVFDEIADARYDLVIHMGDMHYQDITQNDTQLFRDAFALVHGSPRQRRLFRSAPVAYMWDDHDFGPNNGDMFSPARDAALAAFKECVPHPQIPNKPHAVYHAFSVGRVRFVLPDLRSEYAPGIGIMSDEQLSWLLREIGGAGDHKLLVLMLGTPWIGDENPEGDGWLTDAATRKRISDAIADAKLAGGYANVIGLGGDAHMLAFDDGSHTSYSDHGAAGFPLMQAGPLHGEGSAKGGPYTTECMGYALQTNHQYGSLEISDSGSNGPDAICVHFRLHRRGEGILFEKRMCGPLLADRASSDVTCSVPLLPPGAMVAVVLAILLLVVELGLVIYVQCKSSLGWQKVFGWSACCGSILFFVLQGVCIVAIATATGRAWFLEPWVSFLFIDILLAMIVAVLVAFAARWEGSMLGRIQA